MKKAILFLTIVCGSQLSGAQTIQSEIQKLAGKYAGEWTTYTIISSGEIRKSMAWKDTLVTSDPVINDTMAYVNVKSIMYFENSKIPPYKMDFKEGLKIKNGKIVSHFMLIMGKEATETQVDANTFIISQPVSAVELNQMGIKDAVMATNTTVKVSIKENGTELDKISRITTLSYRENGQIVTRQFTSMEGFHKKIVK